MKRLVRLVIGWIRRHRRLVAVLVIAVVVPAVVYLMIIVLFLMSFSGETGFLIQDCGGITVAIQGQVQDYNKVPIQAAVIAITNVGVDRSSARIALSTTTDKNGRFQQDHINVFACDTLILSASAKGFAPETIEVDVYPDDKRNIDSIIIKLKKLR